MRVFPLGPVEIIHWGTRLLYVVLFLSFMIIQGYWLYLPSYLFLGSVIALVFPVLVLLEGWEEEGERWPKLTLESI